MASTSLRPQRASSQPRATDRTNFDNLHHRPSLLIVDPNPQMRSILRSLLQDQGFVRLREAADFSIAANLLKTTDFSAAIVDSSPPGLDGISFTRQLRRGVLGGSPMMPVLLISAALDLNIVFQARDAGVNEFLAKPITAAVLIKRLRQMMRAPRTFIAVPSYRGPCRRRHAGAAPYYGPYRRFDDPAIVDTCRKTG